VTSNWTSGKLYAADMCVEVGSHTVTHLTVIGYRSDFATACNRFLFTLPLPICQIKRIKQQQTFFKE